MPRARQLLSIFIIAVFSTCSFPAYCGQLADFEKAVSTPKKHKTSSSSHKNRDDDDDYNPVGDAISEELFSPMCETFSYGIFMACRYLLYDWWAKPDRIPKSTLAPSQPKKTQPNSNGYAKREEIIATDLFSGESPPGIPAEKKMPPPLPPAEPYTHQLGDPIVPYVRFDYQWQYLDRHTDADCYTLEAGYEFISLLGQTSWYADRKEHNKTHIDQYYLLLRAGGIGASTALKMEIAVGLGYWQNVFPQSRQESFSATLPCGFYGKNLGIEFRPAWARFNGRYLSDYDLCLTAGRKYLQLQCGYRWFYLQNVGSQLKGPHAGISIIF